MKHLVKSLVVLACVAAWSVSALAEDLSPAPWESWMPAEYPTTVQAWEAYGTTGTILPSETVIPAEWGQNPFGWPPTMTFLDPVTVEVIPGPTQELIPTWHIDAQGPGTFGKVVIRIKNNPEPNDQKLIFWQVTSDKSPTPQGNPPTTNPPGTSVPTGIPHYQHPNMPWYTYNGMIQIRPNPPEETITFEFAESTNISEIVIKTVCAPIPEPSTVMLVGSGLVGMAVCLWRRRR